MSDVSAIEKEAKWQERLARSYKDLIITVAFGVIGNTVLFFGLYYYSPDNTLVELLGTVIIATPLLLKGFLAGPLKSMFFWKDYEVITTYSDGSTKSDGGVQSAQMNFIGIIFGFCALVVLGIVITIAKAAWLTVKSITCYLAVKEKPNFLKSPFLVFILGWVGLIGGMWLSQNVTPTVHDKIIAIEPQQAVVTYRVTNINEQPIGVRGSSPTVIEVKKDDIVTVVEKEVKNFGETSVPVEYQGKTGWIDTASINMNAAAVAKANLPAVIDALMPTIDSIMTPVNIASKPVEPVGGNGIDWGWIIIHSIAYRDDFTVLKISNGHWNLDDVTLPDRGTEGSYFI